MTTIRHAISSSTWPRLLAGLCLALLAALWTAPAAAAFDPFDHKHGAWDALLSKHVVVAPDGLSSTVRYAAMKRDRAALGAYLASLSAVTPQDYAGWSKPQQLAFLINAYNAYTVELILTRYPELKSIKDIGSFFESPWKKDFFSLLGKKRSLDDIEHGMIRAPGVFDDPRIHFAVVCASVGCPMLRKEVFVAESLEAQLEDGLRRFLSDRSRNRYDSASGTLQVSKIFDWYGKDFEQGHKGIDSLPRLFARHAEQLADAPAAREASRSGRPKITFLDYDWALNDAR